MNEKNFITFSNMMKNQHLIRPSLEISLHQNYILTNWNQNQNFSLLDRIGCDITLNVTDTKQYIATEGYPDNYKNDQDCSFRFEAPPSRGIIVMFEHFELEVDYDFIYFRKSHKLKEFFLVLQDAFNPFQKQNTKQYLYLRFYISANGIRYYAKPPTFRSDSNSVTLRFTSDYSTTESGILMAYILGTNIILNLVFFRGFPK